ncbi:MAG: DUF4330 family protein [Ruminococcaceae bacterium]|nr:DUF4330 family protein [Oscillospiraceae bacterium]
MAKNKKSFNLLDVLIVLAVLCLIAGILWRKELTAVVEQHAKENATNVFCTCTVVEFENGEKAKLPSDITDVYYKGEKIGVLVPSVVTDEVSEEDTTNDIPTVAVKFTAVEEDSGYYINGTKLVLGEEYSLYTDLYEFTVRIEQITE